MVDKEIIERNLQMPTMSKALLGRLWSGEITVDKFLEESAYWGMEYLDKYKYQEFPQKPQEIIDYVNRKRYDSNCQVSSDFWRQDFVVVYIENWHKVFAENTAHRNWLKEMQRYIPEEDILNQQKIVDTLATFKGNINNWLRN